MEMHTICDVIFFAFIKQMSQSHTVPADTASIYHTEVYTGIETLVFCAGLNTDCTRLI